LVLSLLLAVFLGSAQAQEGAYQSACFHGLNDADTPATLNNCDAQDALNVESNLEGSAILKRKGFSKTADLTVSTSPVTGSHSFIDSSGNRLDIVCQDRNCAKSTNGNAFSTFLTTAAAGITRWSFVDVGGVLYGANNKYDPIMAYDGTTRTSPPGMPQGSILELTGDRLAVGDISGQPNRVHLSSAGNYTAFTLGVNPEDSYFDDFGAPGDKVRGLKHLDGILYVFKTASISACELGNQYTTRCSILSPNIGTTDPGSITTAGNCLYFRAQDKNYWELCGGALRQISAKIPNLVKSQSGGLGGGENSNTQTTQADWQAGVQFPTGTWNLNTIPGSMFPASTTVSDLSPAFVFSGVTSSYTFRFEGNTLPLSDGWTVGTVGGTAPNQAVTNGIYTQSFISINDTYRVVRALGSTSQSKSLVFNARHSANNDGYTMVGAAADSTGVLGNAPYVIIRNNATQYFSDGVQIFSEARDQTAFSTFTIIVTSHPATYFYRDGVFKASVTATNAYSATAYAFMGGATEAGDTSGVASFDFLYPAVGVAATGRADIGSVSTFTSRVLESGVPASIYGQFTSAVSLQAGATMSFSVRFSSSPNDDMWSYYQSIANGGIAVGSVTANRYAQYRATYTFTSLIESPSVSTTSLVFVTTGQFVTRCIQPNSSISSWGTLSCADTTAGSGSIVYYATSAATCETLPATAPLTWQTSLTNNATVTIATNTAVYIGWRSLLGSATDQAQVDACTLAWNEGTPAQPSWAVYDSIKDSIYWTTTINGAPYSNRLLKFDRRLGAWFPFSIQAQAPRLINNSLYFGAASSGTWNLYGLVDSDDGRPINAYWQSKDVGSANPFVEKEFKNVSLLSRNNGAGSLTATYTFSNGEMGDYTVSLSTGSGITYARSNFNLPKTSPQNFMSLRVGNNSTTPFEVLGLGITWLSWPWNVTGP